jgi:hypothetical protein
MPVLHQALQRSAAVEFEYRAPHDARPCTVESGRCVFPESQEACGRAHAQLHAVVLTVVQMGADLTLHGLTAERDLLWVCVSWQSTVRC